MKEPDPIQLKAFYEKLKAASYAEGHGDCWDVWMKLNNRIVERDKRIAELEAALDARRKESELKHRYQITLEQRIEALEEKCDQKNEALEKIRSWCEAYPLDIFPEVTKEEWAEIHRTLKRELGIPLDRIAANNMRHVINGVAALLPGRG